MFHYLLSLKHRELSAILILVTYILYNIPRDKWREYTQFLRTSPEEASTIKTNQEAKEFLCEYHKYDEL